MRRSSSYATGDLNPNDVRGKPGFIKICDCSFMLCAPHARHVLHRDRRKRLVFRNV